MNLQMASHFIASCVQDNDRLVWRISVIVVELNLVGVSFHFLQPLTPCLVEVFGRLRNLFCFSANVEDVYVVSC